MNGRRKVVVTVLGSLVMMAPLVSWVPTSAGATVGARTTLEWSPVTRLAPNPQSQALAVDGRGTVTAVWATSSWPHRVVAVRRPAEGSWGTPRVRGRGYAPVVDADARGNVTVVWLNRREGFTDGVLAVRRPAGGVWSDPVRLTRDRSVPDYPSGGEEPYGAADVDLAVNGRGAAVATWTWGSDDRDVPWRIQASVRPPAGLWAGPRDVTARGPVRHPDVDIAADGTATLVYGRQPFGSPQALVARRRIPGVGWTRPTTVTGEGYAHTLGVDRAGNATLAFSPDFSRVRAAFRPADGRWRLPERISPAGAQVSDFALAVNAPGLALVAMGRSGGRVDVVERTPRTPWTDPQLVAPRGEPVCEVLPALDDAGDAFVGWGCYSLHGRYRPGGSTWTDPWTISPDSGVEVLESASVVVAPGGDVTVVWDQEELPLKARVLDVP